MYSTNFTSSQGVGNSESVVRIPFFTLIRRLSEKRFVLILCKLDNFIISFLCRIE